MSQLDAIEDECLKHSLQYERDLTETSDTITRTLLQSSHVREKVHRKFQLPKKKKKKTKTRKTLSECGRSTYLRSMSTKSHRPRRKKIITRNAMTTIYNNEVDDAFVGDLPVTMSAISIKKLSDIAKANTIQVDSKFCHLKPRHYESRQWYRKERYKSINKKDILDTIHPDTWRSTQNKKQRHDSGKMWHTSQNNNTKTFPFMVNTITGELLMQKSNN
jgi:hypothetical protein